jgi:hypothetical protein
MATTKSSSILLIKRSLSTVALLLWFSSLFLPVFEEVAEESRVLLGRDMLVFTFGWLTPALVGIPWALMNLGVIGLSLINVLGGASRWGGIAFVALAMILTAVLVGAHSLALAGGWITSNALQVGIIPWTLSMILVGIATAMDDRWLARTADLSRMT